MAGLSTYPQRKAVFEVQRAHVEAEIVRMNRTLDMLKFKCWYYEQAIRDGGEEGLAAMIPGDLPEEIRTAERASRVMRSVKNKRGARIDDRACGATKKEGRSCEKACFGSRNGSPSE